MGFRIEVTTSATKMAITTAATSARLHTMSATMMRIPRIIHAEVPALRSHVGMSFEYPRAWALENRGGMPLDSPRIWFRRCCRGKASWERGRGVSDGIPATLAVVLRDMIEWAVAPARDASRLILPLSSFLLTVSA